MQLEFNKNSLIPGVHLATLSLAEETKTNADFLQKAELKFGEQNIVAEQTFQPDITS